MTRTHVRVTAAFWCNLMDTRVNVEIDWLQPVEVSRLKDGQTPTDKKTFSVNGSLIYQTTLPPFSLQLTIPHLVSMEGVPVEETTYSSLMGVVEMQTFLRRFVALLNSTVEVFQF
jgi:hypothetical protein